LRGCERILKKDGSLFYLNYPEFNSKIYVALQEDFYLKPIEVIAWTYNTHNGGKPLRKSFRTWIWASKGEPIKMINKIILSASEKDDIILDPFLGSGTTAVSAKKNNRKYIGIEISPQYCKIAQDRLNALGEPLF
jgi:DNA modification methylase